MLNEKSAEIQQWIFLQILLIRACSCELICYTSITWKTSFAFSCLEYNFALGLKTLLIPFMSLITLPSRTNKHKTVPIDHWFHMDGLGMLSILISVWSVQTNLRYHKHWQGWYSSEIQWLLNLLPFASYMYRSVQVWKRVCSRFKRWRLESQT
jgi:hypothetical protein